MMNLNSPNTSIILYSYVIIISINMIIVSASQSSSSMTKQASFWDYLGCFSLVLVFSLNWLCSVKWHTVGLRKDPFVIDVSDSLAGYFGHRNGTLLSPEGQDQRWKDFLEYYKHLQKKLANTGKEYYVIYTTTYSGLANKLNGMVSGLLLAMVTNRGFQCADIEYY